MHRFRSSLNNLCSVMLAFVMGSPLAAQLNPAWQTSNSPDFLDLYQKSSGNKTKPEIVTVFDFSGSMQSLMYHPCYFNTEANDVVNGDTTGITFKLTGATGSMTVTAVVGPPSWGYSSTQLIRPDGSLVTETNVNTTATGTGLWGDKTVTLASTQACDVRNWVRSASHIRIKRGSRTIDLPIPWKVMDASSTGYPLSSMTVTDKYVDPETGTSYGSGNAIEVDTRYMIQTGFPDSATAANNRVLSGDQNQIVTTTKFMLRLSQSYLDWLFTGTYQTTDPTRPDYCALASGMSGKFIIFDAADAALAGGQTNVKQGQGFGTFGAETMHFWNPSTQADEIKSAKANVIPARDRVQAVKEAAIRTWINYQSRVFWAFRFLDDVGEANSGSATTINHDSRSTITTPGVPTTWVNGNDTGWTLLNNGSVAGMNRIAALFPYTNTPLCYATARALAQFSDPDNIFGDAETGTYPVECQKHFLILFTDGVPTAADNKSGDNSGTPYITSGLKGSAEEGNAQLWNQATGTLKTASANINPGGSWWNIFTYAGIAAHLSDDTKSEITSRMPLPTAYPAGNAAPSAFLPFAIPSRKTVTIPQPYRLVTTMTIGVSLPGVHTDATSPKRRLFLAAAVGDPERTSWDLGALKPFTAVLKDAALDPNDPKNYTKTSDSVYFFDATSPDLLIKYLNLAFDATNSPGGTASTSVPVIPWIGGGLSDQIYLASFTVPKGGGPVWSGDVRMFPTKDVTLTDLVTGSKTQTLVLDKTGVEVTGDLSAPTSGANAVTPAWSASDQLEANGWRSRKIYTRLPSSSGTPNPPIYPIPTSLKASDLSTGSYTDLAAALPGADVNAKLKNLRWMMGADVNGPVDSNSIPTNTRRKVYLDGVLTVPGVMGDVVDSAPAFLEYLDPTKASSLPTSLSSAWASAPTASRHFRTIFVGTNQGVIHAFGEVSFNKTVGSGPSATTIKDAVVDELWAFIPTDILKYCNYYQASGNSHRFGVNGTPYLYFLDLPQSGNRSGDGKMDITSTTERATLIMGLGKGGRSYYAIDVRDPSAPKLGDAGGNGWALVPDEASSYPASIFETSTKDTTLIGNMGWSTCQPTIGRIITGSGTTQFIRDVVFLGGGFSLPEIEQNYPTTGAKTPLGRSALALDVTNGHVVNYWELPKDSDNKVVNGPVGAGVMPMQVTPYSGLTQRAYFTDFFGGLWALGSTKDSTVSGMSGFRVDSSSIWDWSCRPVYHQDSPNGLLSTMPAPFLVSNFYPRTAAPFVTPLTVGVTMVSGDRNNPMDTFYTASTKPTQHRLTVVFDRQDSNKLGLDAAGGIKDADLADMSSQTDPYAAVIQPGNSAFYLNDKYGYYLNFPARPASVQYVPKGLVTPIVLTGKLFYSYFSPSGYVDNNPCNPGTGTTSTVRVCNVMTPTFPGTSVAWSSATADAHSCASGEVFTWVGLASRFSPKSILAALQAGMLPTTSTDPNKKGTNDLKIKSFEGVLEKAIAGPKVWRTVQ